MSSDLNDLLQPTVAEAVARRKPWRVSSQFWVAFFGGVPAVTAIAYVNSGRLGMSTGKRRLILIAGVVAAAVSIALALWLVSVTDGRRTARLAMQVTAVLLFLVLARIQRDDDGRHQVFGSGEYASLWIPGIVASLLSGIVVVSVAVAVIMWMK